MKKSNVANNSEENIKADNFTNNKPFYHTAIFRITTGIVLITFITAIVFLLIKKTNDNLAVNNSSSKNTQNKNVIYISADSPDIYGDYTDSALDLHGDYLSSKLKSKMDLYKDCKDEEVVYRAIVAIFIAQEDYEQADKLVDANKEVQLLTEQAISAREAEQKARTEYQSFFKANPGNEPELIAKRKQMVADIEEKEKIRKELNYKIGTLREKILNEYINQVKEERLEFATRFSEKEPVAVSHNEWVYYMDLTADEINLLAEQGGYMIALAS